MNDRFRFRVWDPEDKIYTSFPWFARAHNSHLEVDYPLVLEQCTGLRDKNGTLIFEGDVVRTVTRAIGVVIFYEDLARFVVRFENAQMCNVVATQQVIGNIHEMEATNG